MSHCRESTRQPGESPARSGLGGEGEIYGLYLIFSREAPKGFVGAVLAQASFMLDAPGPLSGRLIRGLSVSTDLKRSPSG